MTIDEVLEGYLLQLDANGRSGHTISQARRHVRLFGAWLATQGLSGEIHEVGHEVMARFLVSPVVRRRADGGVRKASSANAIRGSLRAFFAFVEAAGLAPTNAARLVRRANVPAPTPKALSPEEEAKLVAALARATSPQERRDRVLYSLMLRAGLRLGSALALDVEDVDLARAQLCLRSVKGGGETTAFVPAEVVDLLRAHIGTRRHGPLFLGSHGGRLGGRHARRRLALWAAAAGIEGGVHPHQLRHTFGQAVYDRTGDLLVTSRALGHRSLNSTQVYARASDGAVRSAVGG